MSTQQTIALAVVLFVVMGLIFWRAAREKKPTGPKPAVELFDEGDLQLENKPWSPTRGLYSFRVADLPEVYRGLSGLAGNQLATQLGEDLVDAQTKLGGFLAEKHLKETGRPVVEPITAPLFRFKALTQRKRDKAHAR